LLSLQNDRNGKAFATECISTTLLAHPQTSKDYASNLILAVNTLNGRRTGFYQAKPAAGCGIVALPYVIWITYNQLLDEESHDHASEKNGGQGTVFLVIMLLQHLT